MGPKDEPGMLALLLGLATSLYVLTWLVAAPPAARPTPATLPAPAIKVALSAYQVDPEPAAQPHRERPPARVPGRSLPRTSATRSAARTRSQGLRHDRAYRVAGGAPAARWHQASPRRQNSQVGSAASAPPWRRETITLSTLSGTIRWR